MQYMCFPGVAKRFFKIISPFNGFAPLDQLRTIDVADSPTTSPTMVFAVVPARPHDLELAFHNLNYCFFRALHDIPGSNHLYIGDDVAKEEWNVLRKFQERSYLLPEVFLTLQSEITVPLNMERPTNHEVVRSKREYPIGDSSLITQSEYPRP